jgi:hypothetical protein
LPLTLKQRTGRGSCRRLEIEAMRRQSLVPG